MILYLGKYQPALPSYVRHTSDSVSTRLHQERASTFPAPIVVTVVLITKSITQRVRRASPTSPVAASQASSLGENGPNQNHITSPVRSGVWGREPTGLESRFLPCRIALFPANRAQAGRLYITLVRERPANLGKCDTNLPSRGKVHTSSPRASQRSSYSTFSDRSRFTSHSVQPAGSMDCADLSICSRDICCD